MAFVILFIVVGFSLIYWTLKLGISPMPSSKKAEKALMRVLPAQYSGTIYDLGSGFGTMLMFFAHRYPEATVIGYEKSWIPYLVSKLLLWRTKVEVRRRDFRGDTFAHSWVYLYLFSRGTRALDPKMFQDCLVISNTFQLSVPYRKRVEIGDLWHSYFYFYGGVM